MQDRIFAFDVGKASLGICVRTETEILELNAFEIPPEFAMTSDFRNRRRAQRTRFAHKKREAWLLQKWSEAGLEAIPTSDERMQREFPKKGDNTLYNSAILRVALIQDKQLAPWQIFKALWSAIQLRGYDANIPWGRNYIPQDEQQVKDERENKESAEKFKERLYEAISPHFEYEYPCFLAASMMGLWSSEKPEQLQSRINHSAQKVRRKPGTLSDSDPGNVAPRQLVEKEIKALFENAQKQLPQLANLNVDVLLYGEAQKSYASYTDQKHYRYRGTEWDTQGVLSQKIPRFDNRIIGKCRLLPTRNTCKAKEPLSIDFTLLTKLKNLRFTDENGEFNRGLNIEEFKRVFGLLKENLDNKKSNELTTGTIKKAVEKAIRMKIYDLNMAEKEKLKINTGGRSRFCRPALRLMVDILLSGQNPPEFDLSPYIQNSTVLNPIQRPELEKAVSRLGETWEKFHVGDDRNNEIVQSPYLERQQVILKTIGSVNNPVVRHRLVLFYNQLQRLTQTYGQPDCVILEFIRGSEGLEGQKTAQQWDKFIKDNETKKDSLREDLKKLGYPITNGNIERLKLLREQGSKCLYTGNSLVETQLHLYQVDHIVPISMDMSTDAFYNKVICIPEANASKTNKTPFEWLNDKPEWEIYAERIRNIKTIGNKKRQLLLSKNARELVESYNGLAETAYIARLAQQIVSLHFGWGLQTKGDNRRIFVSNGRETAKIRHIYHLNELLLTPEERKTLKLGDKINKNRKNPKHHALDAYCISYSKKLTSKRKPNGDICWEVPELKITKPQLEPKLNELFPKNLCRNKKDLYPAETIYGLRKRKDKYYMVAKPVTCDSLRELIGNDRNKIKSIYDEDIRQDLLEKSKLINNNAEWNQFLESYQHPKRKSNVRKVRIIEGKPFTTEPSKDSTGRIILGEFKDFGKGLTKGQFKKKKQSHQGQLILILPNKRYQVRPIYIHESQQMVVNQMKENQISTYNNGMLFYAGCIIYVPNNFKSSNGKQYPEGYYKSRKIKTEGAVLLEDSTGLEIPTNIRYLVEASFTLADYNGMTKVLVSET